MKTKSHSSDGVCEFKSLGGKGNQNEKRPSVEQRARFQYQKNFNELRVNPQRHGSGTIIRFALAGYSTFSPESALLASTDE